MRHSLIALCAVVAAATARPQQMMPAHGAEVRTALDRQPLPALDGAHVKVSVVEVRYAAGEHSAPHRHSCPVIGYIAEGAVRMRFEGGRDTVYRAGDAFYEAANRVHEVSANASDRAPARLVATFVCDHDAALSSPASEHPNPRGMR